METVKGLESLYLLDIDSVSRFKLYEASLSVYLGLAPAAEELF